MGSSLQERYQRNSYHKFQRCQIEFFLSCLTASNYKNTLDVGCGKGFFSYIGARQKKFENCYACDVYNDYQIEEISKFANVIYKPVNKNGTLPFVDDFFDLVFSVDVIEHVEDDIKFIREKIRVCKRGGEIIIGTPNYFRITNLFLLFLGKLKYPRKMGVDSYGDVIHLREYSLNKLIDKVIFASDGLIIKKDIEVLPCWLGIMLYNIGLNTVPFFLKWMCQFWFIKFKKK